MDFFLDDDDDDRELPPSQRSGSGKAEDSFVCHNCGGTSCYTDSNSGNLVCTDCFTQSQTLISASQQELDLEEIAGLANTGAGNRVVGRNRYRRAGPDKAQSLEQLDQTKPLAAVGDCIIGMQRVLLEATRIACDLVPTSEKRRILKSVKTMWQSYLKSWHDGAEYFGAIYPEVRFSFRDHFLDSVTRRNLINTLAYWSANRLREEIIKETQDEDSDSDSDDSDSDDSDKTARHRLSNSIPDHNDAVDGDSESDQSSESIPSHKHNNTNDPIDLVNDELYLPETVVKRKQEDEKSKVSAITMGVRSRRVSVPQIENMIHYHYGGRKRKRAVGRRAAALMLKPSMTMVAAMLWIALSPIGVTGSHIRDWIADGSLPLLDAFSLLNDAEQEKLRTIRLFFRLPSVPSIRVLQRHVRTLHVACRYKPRKILVKKKGSEKKFVAISTLDFTPGRVITPDSVPMVAARFISGFGLGQKVLDFTLALMGIRVSRNDWLPPALFKARPDRLLCPSRVLGVIVVACKLAPLVDTSSGFRAREPEWHQHQYNRPLVKSTNGMGYIHRGRADGISTRKVRRFIPWTTQYFRLVSQGDLMRDYVDFIEQEVVDSKEPLIVANIQTMESVSEVKPSSPVNVDDANDGAHRVPAQTAEIPKAGTRFQGEQIIPNYTLRHYKQRYEKKPMRHSIISRKYEISKISNNSFHSPTAAPLGPLIEYMANRSDTSPADIAKFVAQLDRALEKKGIPW